MENAIKINGQYESVTFNTNVIQTQGKSVIKLYAKIDDNQFIPQLTIPKCNTITKIELPIVVRLKLVSTHPFKYSIPGFINPYLNKHKIEDFLYDITYTNLDYNYAKNNFIPVTGGCSAIRNGNFFGRNFDWLYNNQVQFVVHTPQTLEHNEVLGVSGIIPGITKDNVDMPFIIIDGLDMFKLLPFYLLDGINEKGVFCTHNVVPLDDQDNPTIEVIAQKEEKERIAVPMLVRYILDKFDTADDAINYIKDYVTVYFTDTMISEWKYQSHFLIGDNKTTYVMEFINNELVILNADHITNFLIKDVEFNELGNIQYPPTQYGINKFGTGLERYDISTCLYQQASTLEGMRDLLEELKFSKAYAYPSRISEFVGLEDDNGNIITVDTNEDECLNTVEQLIDDFNNKDRDNPKVWITCHSSIYDIKNKILYLKNQENDTEYEFSIH